MSPAISTNLSTICATSSWIEKKRIGWAKMLEPSLLPGTAWTASSRIGTTRLNWPHKIQGRIEYCFYDRLSEARCESSVAGRKKINGATKWHGEDTARIWIDQHGLRVLVSMPV